MRRALLAAVLAAPLAAGPAHAAPEEAAPACPAAQAAEFAGAKDFRLWVTRQGTMTVSNPLRPLSPESVQVLQVVIRNRLATAYGPDLSGLRRGPSPAALEAQNGAVIQWAGSPQGLPPILRILADDGGQVLAELKFQACGDAPKVAEPKAPKPAPTARAAPKGKAASKGEGSKGEGSKGEASKGEVAPADGAAGEPAADAVKPAAPRAPRPKREKAVPAEPASRTPGGLALPQGAIP